MSSSERNGYAVKGTLGIQPGQFDAGDRGVFGPGDVALLLSFGSLPGKALSFDLTLEDGYTVVPRFDRKNLSSIYTGGALPISGILDLVKQVLTLIDGVVPGDALPVDEILQAVADAVAPYADIDIDKDGTNDGFSIGLVASAAATTIAK